MPPSLEDDRNVFANTHFQEWWFKTFLYDVTAIAACNF
ncbi:hypothetical protein FIU87_10440 [Bacillus sp. THAF10]|nr:hypothetical protein FIU87_10440 [Bacillus sp. THAF10]